MSTPLLDRNTELPNSSLPVDPETGVFRASIWYETDAAAHGDYTVGPQFEAYYERWTDNTDGPPTVERWDEAFYAEALRREAPNDLVLTNSTHYLRGTPEQMETQWYAAEDYDYDLASPFGFDARDMPRVVAELQRLAFQDLRWCYPR